MCNLSLPGAVGWQMFEGDLRVNDNPEITEYIKKIEESKLALRRELARLPYEEKIRRIIEMQRFAREFRKDRSEEIFAWDME